VDSNHYKKQNEIALKQYRRSVKASELELGRLFVEDGIINIEKWYKAKLKVLFLTKKPVGIPANLFNHKVFDLTDIENDVIKSKLCEVLNIKRVGQWGYGLNNHSGTEAAMYFEARNNASEFLDSIAVVNIDKTMSEKGVKHSSYSACLRETSDAIKAQIEAINPDIIVCCKTLSSAKRRLFGNELKEIGTNLYSVNQLLVIDHYNSNARLNEEQMYNTLMDIYAQR